MPAPPSCKQQHTMCVFEAALHAHRDLSASPVHMLGVDCSVNTCASLHPHAVCAYKLHYSQQCRN
jgi:hypothetical protein